MRKIVVVPYDASWTGRFQVEAERIMDTLGKVVLAVHHIGSTSIPGMQSKPTIDLLVEASNLEEIDLLVYRMFNLGYEPRGENGVPGRRYFVKYSGEAHLYHVHVFLRGNPEIDRHIDFRDYLIAHPAAAQAYGLLKEELAAKFPFDPAAYSDGKENFIHQIDLKAHQWQLSREHNP